jgi:nitroreductase
MIPKEILLKIIKAGSLAPSADNGQPWRFKITEQQDVELFRHPGMFEKDLSVLKEVSLIGHGAVIENMRIASAYFSYQMRVDFFPDAGNSNLVARLNFDARQDKDLYLASLYNFITKRCTNRSPYKNAALTELENKKLTGAGDDFKDVMLKIIADKESVRGLAEAVSTNERVVLSNPVLHKYFFNLIRFSQSKTEQTQNGMHVRTLAMPPPAEMIFYLCKYWPIMKFLSFFGLIKTIARQNSKIYQNSAAFGVLLIKEPSPINFINTGQAMQKIWLQATALGLQFQPTAAVPYYAREASEKNNPIFGGNEKELLLSAYKTIKKISADPNLTVSFVFRIGQGLPPRARTTRLELSKLLIA